MIPELDRYHGVVLRQMLIACNRPVSIGVADVSGRVDAFCIEDSAFQIKHSSKRLSPWQFTYLQENLDELSALRQKFGSVWVMLVCGIDGVVALSLEELSSIVRIGDVGVGSVRVSRSRNSMYRVSGAQGELARAKPRGVQGFISQVIGTPVEQSSE